MADHGLHRSTARVVEMMNETLFAISGPGDHPGLTCVASEIKRLERVVSELDWDDLYSAPESRRLTALRQLQREGVEYVCNH